MIDFEASVIDVLVSPVPELAKELLLVVVDVLRYVPEKFMLSYALLHEEESDELVHSQPARSAAAARAESGVRKAKCFMMFWKLDTVW